LNNYDFEYHFPLKLIELTNRIPLYIHFEYHEKIREEWEEFSEEEKKSKKFGKKSKKKKKKKKKGKKKKKKKKNFEKK